MSKLRIQIAHFLNKYQMDLAGFSFMNYCQHFIREMNRGLAGKESSLSMIPAYIDMVGWVPKAKPVIVVDAGGTNFRVAVVSFAENCTPQIGDFKVYPMPGIDREISKDEFYKTFASYLQPVIHKSDQIGICFSYAIEHLPNHDARIMMFAKQIKANDAVGTMIGESLCQALRELGLPADKKIVVINDTIATHLSALQLCTDNSANYLAASLREEKPAVNRDLVATRKFDGYIGFILGTGTNTCYAEANSCITKVGSHANRFANGSMLINVESGGYNGFPQGAIDREYDSNLVDTGLYTYEKMVAGKYLGGLLLTLIQRAAAEGLFSDSFTTKLGRIKELNSRELSDFLDFPYWKYTRSENTNGHCTDAHARHKLAKLCANDDDRMTLYYLIDALLDRAALFVAVNLAAIMKKTGQGKNPCRPVCIVAEGATFKKSKLFRGKLDYYIRRYINDGLSLYCEIVERDNSTLIGTAVAGLSTCSMKA